MGNTMSGVGVFCELEAVEAIEQIATGADLHFHTHIALATHDLV
jgi:DNA-binding FadR family transcriptional regulator